MGVNISKRYSSSSFHPISTKLYGKYGFQGGIQAITLFGDMPNHKKNYDTFKFLTQDHMCQDISKRYPPKVFIRSQPNVMRILATMLKYRPLFFLAFGHVLKILWQFEMLTWKSMGKL